MNMNDPFGKPLNLPHLLWGVLDSNLRPKIEGRFDQEMASTLWRGHMFGIQFALDSHRGRLLLEIIGDDE